MASPRVTVLMSVYNGEKYLREAIDSILSQTFKDFEFLIINDCSTDRTAEIMESYTDPRVRIVYNETNIGLTKSLNKGLKLAKGEYVARMDADDISLPERLQKQVEFLDVHPEVGVLGTWAEVIDESGGCVFEWRMPEDPALLKWLMVFANNLIHASVMFRRCVIEPLGYYDSAVRCSQDYDLWCRACSKTSLCNLPVILMRWRHWAGNITALKSQAQHLTALRTRQRFVSSILGYEVPEWAVAGLKPLAVHTPLSDLMQIRASAKLIQELYRKYVKSTNLNRLQADMIDQDAARRLHQLGSWAMLKSRWAGLTIHFQALQIYPGIFSIALLKSISRLIIRRYVRGLFGVLALVKRVGRTA